MSALDDFVRRRTRAADRVLALADELEHAELVPQDRVALLRNAAERARDGRFVVLLVGCFSSGKSTLLNALLGEPVLPVKVNPCTAILTEVEHRPEPVVEVHFRDGRMEAMPPSEFSARYQLTTGEDVAGAEADDRFGDVDRAVVGYPLPLLANGVVLLDTPGLDDDPRRTARTLSSLPDADAVIFVLSANRFLSDLERRTLSRDLLPLGLTNLFFPVTMVDLLANLADDPAAAQREIEARGREFLGPLVPGAFGRRFFLLDARSGLHGRWDRAARTRRLDPATLERSGLLGFERSLEAFLVEERGPVQLASLRASTLRLRDEVARLAAVDRATADQSVDELRKRQEQLEPAFRQLEAIARRVERTVDSFVERQRTLVWQDLRTFVIETEELLPEAIAELDLGDLAGLDLWTPHGRTRIEAGLRTGLEAWLEKRMGLWQASLKSKIEAALAELRRELAADGDDFDALAGRIVTDFAGPALRLPGAHRASDAPPVDTIERWFSVAMGAVLLSPGTMAAGWAEGYEGALKGAASRLGIRLALLAIGAMLGPIGWAGLVIYALGDAALLVLTGGSQLKRLREQVAGQLRGKLVAQVDAARDEISARVAEGLRPIRDGLVGAARDEAVDLASTLSRTIDARAVLVRDAARRAETWIALDAAFTVALADDDAAPGTT